MVKVDLREENSWRNQLKQNHQEVIHCLNCDIFVSLTLYWCHINEDKNHKASFALNVFFPKSLNSGEPYIPTPIPSPEASCNERSEEELNGALFWDISIGRWGFRDSFLYILGFGVGNLYALLKKGGLSQKFCFSRMLSFFTWISLKSLDFNTPREGTFAGQLISLFFKYASSLGIADLKKWLGWSIH